MRLHDLRHTHATLMLRQGVHPKVVSERPGHSSLAILGGIVVCCADFEYNIGGDDRIRTGE